MNSLEDRVAALEKAIMAVSGSPDQMIPAVFQRGPQRTTPINGNGETPQAMKLLGVRRRDAAKKPLYEGLGLKGGDNGLIIWPHNEDLIAVLTMIANAQQAQAESEFRLIEFTADATLDTGQSGAWITNKGALGAVVLTLPTAAVGLRYKFSVEAAQNFKIVAAGPSGSDKIQFGNIEGSAAGFRQCADIGSKLLLVCLKTGYWTTESRMGEWAEA